jgi:4-nitrophenyl phosphatase
LTYLPQTLTPVLVLIFVPVLVLVLVLVLVRVRVLPKKKAYIVGETGIGQELSLVGIEWFGSDHDSGEHTYEDVINTPLNPEVGAVIVGLDRKLNYKKLAMAQGYLLRSESPCLFIATNTDTSFPAPNRLAPGSGSIVAAISTASHREPVVLGKPNR